MMSLSEAAPTSGYEANLLVSNILARDCEMKSQHPVMNHMANPCHACNSTSQVVLLQDALLELAKKDFDEV